MIGRVKYNYLFLRCNTERHTCQDEGANDIKASCSTLHFLSKKVKIQNTN